MFPNAKKKFSWYSENHFFLTARIPFLSTFFPIARKNLSLQVQNSCGKTNVLFYEKKNFIGTRIFPCSKKKILVASKILAERKKKCFVTT